MTSLGQVVPRPSGPCPRCGAAADRQRQFTGPQGAQWRCGDCHFNTGQVLPFDPRTAPDGRSEAAAAIRTLAVLVPVFSTVDLTLVYGIVRPYLQAGWCIRDVVYALNYRPDGTAHLGNAVAWTRQEGQRTTLARLQARLRQWRWADQDGDQDIMPGPYTAMIEAMRANQDALARRTAIRRAGWEQQAAAWAVSSGAGLTEARRVAAAAATRATRVRITADSREWQQVIQHLELVRRRPDWLESGPEAGRT